MIKKIVLGMLIVIAIAAGFLLYASKKTTTLSLQRTLAAPVAQVWTLWTNPESMKNWWSPKGFTAPVIENDFRVGGTFLFSMKSADGKMFWNTGKYTEIVPNKKIVSLMSFSDENGNIVPASEYGIPGHWPQNVRVTVDFEESEGESKVTVSEVGIPLIMSPFAKMGWQQQFDKFEELLEQSSPQ